MSTYEEYEEAATPTGMILTRNSWDKMTDNGRQRLLEAVQNGLTAALRPPAVVLDTALKARFGFAAAAPLPWQNLTPKVVRDVAIECLADTQAQLEVLAARATKAESRADELVLELLTEWRDNTLPDAGPDADSERRRLNHRAFFDMKCQQLTGRRLEPGGIYAGISAPAPPPSSPAAAPVLIDACEVCAYRQPEDAERPCPRCGNGIYVAMTIGKAYETAKEWAHPTKKRAAPTTGEGKADA